MLELSLFLMVLRKESNAMFVGKYLILILLAWWPIVRILF